MDFVKNTTPLILAAINRRLSLFKNAYVHPLMSPAGKGIEKTRNAWSMSRIPGSVGRVPKGTQLKVSSIRQTYMGVVVDECSSHRRPSLISRGSTTLEPRGLPHLDSVHYVYANA